MIKGTAKSGALVGGVVGRSGPDFLSHFVHASLHLSAQAISEYPLSVEWLADLLSAV